MRGGHYTAYVKVRAPQRKTEQHHKNLPGQGGSLLSPFICSAIVCLYALKWKQPVFCRKGLTLIVLKVFSVKNRMNRNLYVLWLCTVFFLPLRKVLTRTWQTCPCSDTRIKHVLRSASYRMWYILLTCCNINIIITSMFKLRRLQLKEQGRTFSSWVTFPLHGIGYFSRGCFPLQGSTCDSTTSVWLVIIATPLSDQLLVCSGSSQLLVPAQFLWNLDGVGAQKVITRYFYIVENHYSLFYFIYILFYILFLYFIYK